MQVCCVIALGLSAGGAEAQSFATGANRSSVAVRLTIYEPFSPYSDTLYEWKTRGSSPLVSIGHGWVGDYGRENRISLILPDEFDAVLDTLTACTFEPGRADVLPPKTGEVAWAALELEADGRTSRIVYRGVDELRALAPCSDAIRAPADAILPATAFRHPYWEPGTFGMLRTDADVPAYVWINGSPTLQTTPLLDWPVLPGRHRIRWRSLIDGSEREESFTIEVGVTTTVNITLGPNEDP